MGEESLSVKINLEDLLSIVTTLLQCNDAHTSLLAQLTNVAWWKTASVFNAVKTTMRGDYWKGVNEDKVLKFISLLPARGAEKDPMEETFNISHRVEIEFSTYKRYLGLCVDKDLERVERSGWVDTLSIVTWGTPQAVEIMLEAVRAKPARSAVTAFEFMRIMLIQHREAHRLRKERAQTDETKQEAEQERADYEKTRLAWRKMEAEKRRQIAERESMEEELLKKQLDRLDYVSMST